MAHKKKDGSSEGRGERGKGREWRGVKSEDYRVKERNLEGEGKEGGGGKE